MDELIKRLEQATEGDIGSCRVIGGLDDQIWRLVNDKQWLFTGWQYDLKEAPHYTTSIDAALTLVPEGWKWSTCLDTHCEGVVWSGDDEHFGVGASPALALCIAALRARVSEAAREGNG